MIELGTAIVFACIAYWIGESRGEAKVYRLWEAERERRERENRSKP